jgi:repressor LexA
MVIIDRIRSAASFRGVKLGKLCELLGENSNYLGKVERGLRRMDNDQIHKIADFLNVDFEYLTGESEYMIQKTFFTPSAPKTIPLFSYKRYNERRIARHLTPDYSEAQLHLPENYWEDVRNGFITPDKQTVTRLAVLLETTYDYLMGLTDDPRIPSDDRTGVKIKLFGDVAAGIPIKQIDNFDPDDDSSWEEINRSTAKNGIYFALRIKGDSMEPRIMNGDRVIVRYQESVESGQTAVVAINGDTATCKKVFYDDQNGMSLVSNNSKYPPRYFTAEQVRSIPVRILGLVVEIRGLP